MARWFRRGDAAGPNEHLVAPEHADPRDQADLELSYALAVGHDPQGRALAQTELATVPGIARRVAGDLLLADDHRRLVASEWLGRLGDPTAVPALATALGVERVDRVRAAMLGGLEALGEPLADHIDMGRLERAGRLTASRPMPPLLVDFPWAEVPVLHLSDADGVLDADLLKHLVVLAVRAREIEPDAQLRYLAGLVWRDDAEAFAALVEQFWRRHGNDSRRRGLAAVVSAFGTQPAAVRTGSKKPLAHHADAAYREATRKGGGPINE